MSSADAKTELAHIIDVYDKLSAHPWHREHDATNALVEELRPALAKDALDSKERARVVSLKKGFKTFFLPKLELYDQVITEFGADQTHWPAEMRAHFNDNFKFSVKPSELKKYMKRYQKQTRPDQAPKRKTKYTMENPELSARVEQLQHYMDTIKDDVNACKVPKTIKLCAETLAELARARAADTYDMRSAEKNVATLQKKFPSKTQCPGCQAHTATLYEGALCAVCAKSKHMDEELGVLEGRMGEFESEPEPLRAFYQKLEACAQDFEQSPALGTFDKFKKLKEGFLLLYNKLKKDANQREQEEEEMRVANQQPDILNQAEPMDASSEDSALLGSLQDEPSSSEDDLEDLSGIASQSSEVSESSSETPKKKRARGNGSAVVAPKRARVDYEDDARAHFNAFLDGVVERGIMTDKVNWARAVDLMRRGKLQELRAYAEAVLENKPVYKVFGKPAHGDFELFSCDVLFTEEQAHNMGKMLVEKGFYADYKIAH